MRLTETCGCGATLALDPVEPNALPWHLIREWRGRHDVCLGVAAPSGPPDDITDVNDARLSPAIAHRVTVGYALNWDPYGPEDVPDAMRLDLLADYLDRVNRARGVENRVPGDLRRIANELREGT